MPIKQEDTRRRFHIEPDTMLSRFVMSDRPVDIIQGPLGAGKTQALCARIMRHIQQQRVSKITGKRMSRWAIIRNTYTEVRTTTMKTWRELVPEEIYGPITGSPPPTHRLRFADIDAEVMFMGLDREVDLHRLRSMEFTGIAWNELPFIPKILFDEGMGRLRWPGPDHGGSEWHGMIADANAPDEDHWLAIMTGQVPMPPNLTDDERKEYVWPDYWGFWKQPPAVLETRDGAGVLTGYEVNPHAENLANLRKEYYPETWRAKKKSWIDSRLRNEIALVIEGSAVWPQFSIDTHCALTALRPVSGHTVVVGLDFGRQPAAVFMQEVNNRVMVQYELLGWNEGAVTFAPKVSQFLSKHYDGFDDIEFYGDPKGHDKGQADERTAYDIFQAHGMAVRPPPGLKQNMISTRVEAVTSLLTSMSDGKPRFCLSPMCRTLKLAMAGRYHLVKEEDGELQPKKDKYSHVADGLQYGCIGLGEGSRMIGGMALGQMKPIRVYAGRKSMRRIVA